MFYYQKHKRELMLWLLAEPPWNKDKRLCSFEHSIIGTMSDMPVNFRFKNMLVVVV